jgi:DNA-binding response OmpR family regulator
MDNKSKKILIVEDDVSLRKALVEKLTTESFQVLQAEDGEMGLKSALENHPDLIVLDILMPRMNGMEMMKHLRQKTGNKTPIIILTNLEPNDQVVQQVVVDQPSYYFIKTHISLETLVDKIKEILTPKKL